MPFPWLEPLIGPDPARQWAALVGAGLAVGLMLWWLVSRLGRRKPEPLAEAANLSMDISKLPPIGPGKTVPKLIFQGVPVRLAVLVVAPVGRSGEIPPVEELSEVIDNLVPELMQVINAHRPIFRRWPAQLSWQGFTQSFFSNLPLPGDRGKATQWCSVAGRFDAGDRQLLAGMVFCADRPNSLTQVVVKQPAEWATHLRAQAT